MPVLGRETGERSMEATCQPRLPEWKMNDLEKHWKT
jgi:hypothetical protein